MNIKIKINNPMQTNINIIKCKDFTKNKMTLVTKQNEIYVLGKNELHEINISEKDIKSVCHYCTYENTDFWIAIDFEAKEMVISCDDLPKIAGFFGLNNKLSLDEIIASKEDSETLNEKETKKREYER